jgi:hypothetical protein
MQRYLLCAGRRELMREGGTGRGPLSGDAVSQNNSTHGWLGVEVGVPGQFLAFVEELFYIALLDA